MDRSTPPSDRAFLMICVAILAPAAVFALIVFRIYGVDTYHASRAGSTTTPSGPTVPWDTGPRPLRRCSPLRLLRLRLRNRTGLVCWGAET